MPGAKWGCKEKLEYENPQVVGHAPGLSDLSPGPPRLSLAEEMTVKEGLVSRAELLSPVHSCGVQGPGLFLERNAKMNQKYTRLYQASPSSATEKVKKKKIQFGR